MTRLTYVLSLGLVAVLAMPQMAIAQSVSLEPGLYDYSHVVNLGGLQMPADEYEYCVVEGENSKTIEELVAGLAGEGQCTVSNVSMTASTGRADITCTETGLGMDISGTLEAVYGADFYNVDSRADIGPMGQVHVKTKVRRRGVCPVGWDNPDNVSVD